MEVGVKQFKVDLQSTISLDSESMRGKTTFHRMKTTSELAQKFSQASDRRMKS